MDRNVCRLCGEYNAQNERIYDKNSSELLHKIQTSMPIIIHQNDPLPNKICLKCKDFVEVSFDRIQKMKNVQNNLIYELEKQDVFHKYLQIIREIKNLPELEYLDIAYNSLPMFNFDYFDQVGTLSVLRVNVSHNKITELFTNATHYQPIDNRGMMNMGMGMTDLHGMSHSNIKVLDLSHNNISKITPGFFRPCEISLTHLYLGHNYLKNTSRDILGNMQHLQWLDFSHNVIREMDYDTFKGTKKLQVVRLSHNMLSDVPADLFKSVHSLRVIDLSNNRLKGLPDNTFSNDGMESLDLSYNHLSKIPITSLSNMAALTVCELDLSHNRIISIHSMDLSNKFRSLSRIDISHNRLIRLDDAVFATLPRLASLDLSHNNELKVMDRAFFGLENSLIDLGMDNISLTIVPELPLHKLRILRIADNELPSFPHELAMNISSLRVLDLSRNDLTNVPLITQHLPNLRSLSLAGNSITTITNSSFAGIAEKLEHLDISHLNLNVFESGALNRMPNLRSIRLSMYPRVRHFNICEVLEWTENLRDMWIEAPLLHHMQSNPNQGDQSKQQSPPTFSTSLKHEMDCMLPFKLRNITFGGKQFTSIHEDVLRGVRAPFLHVSFYNTSLTSLPENLFKRMRHVQNISLDFRYDNPQLNKIPNPNVAHMPHLPDKVFLTDLRVSGIDLNCDCGIGWVEFWQRKKRQYLCAAQSWSSNIFSSTVHSICELTNKFNCDAIDDDLREAKCSNKQNQQLLEVLKSELECGWGSGAERAEMATAIGILCVIFVVWF